MAKAKKIIKPAPETAKQIAEIGQWSRADSLTSLMVACENWTLELEVFKSCYMDISVHEASIEKIIRRMKKAVDSLKEKLATADPARLVISRLHYLLDSFKTARDQGLLHPENKELLDTYIQRARDIEKVLGGQMHKGDTGFVEMEPPKENTRSLNNKETKIIDALRESGKRMIAEILLPAASLKVDSSGRATLSSMIKEGLVDNKRDGDQHGYGLPEWS